jgi:NAD(P)H dehydrogenase (quinone)
MGVLSVVYHTVSGRTRTMAEAVAEGAREGGAACEVLEVVPADIREGRWENQPLAQRLDASHAIVFGCPTHMGSVSAPMKAFLDFTITRFANEAWKDKLAAGFTVSSVPSGDKLHTLMTFAICAMQLGMVWVGTGRTPINPEGLNRLGIHLGAGAQPLSWEPHDVRIREEDRRTAVHLGRRVAELTARWIG